MGIFAGVFHLSFDEGVGGQAGGSFSAAFADGRIRHEFTGRLARAAFTTATGNFTGIRQAVASDTTRAIIRDWPVHRVPARAFVEGVGPTAGRVFHLVEQVFLAFHQFADDVFEFLGKLGQWGLFHVVGERFLLAPFFAVGRVGKPFLDVRGHLLGHFRAELFEGNGDVGGFLGERVLGHLQLVFDRDEFLEERRVGEILLGKLAQVGMRVGHEARPIVLTGGEILEELLILLGEVVDRLLGEVFTGFDDFLLLFEEVVELVLESAQLILDVGGKLVVGLFLQLGEQFGGFAADVVEEALKHVDDPFLRGRERVGGL